jgi:hypothetical protein
MTRPFRATTLGVALATALQAMPSAVPPAAASETCEMGLSFGLDTTGSLSPAMVRSMRSQFAEALTAPEIVEALVAARASIHVYEWSGTRDQTTVVDWTAPGDADALAAAAEIVGGRTERVSGGTALGAAILYGAAAVDRSGCWDSALNLIADGHGVSDIYIGPPVEVAKLEIDPWLTINAVLIAGDRLVDMYETEVIQGPGSFVLLAEGIEDFGRAIEEKIRREMNVRLRVPYRHLPRHAPPL